MKKVLKLIGLSLILTLILSSTACQGKDSDTLIAEPGEMESETAENKDASVEDSGQSKEPVIKVWFYIGDDSVSEYLKEVKGDDNIEFSAVPYAQYEDVIKSAAAAGSGPDIVGLDSPSLAGLADDGVLAPLDQYTASEDFSDYYTGTLEACKYRGKLYALPLAENSFLLFYNKDLVADAGINMPSDIGSAFSFQQYLEFAKKLTKASGDETLVYGTQPCIDTPDRANRSMMFNYYLYAAAAGGGLISDDGTTATGVFDSSGTKRAMKLIQDLHVSGAAPKYSQNHGFETGRIASVVNGPWMIGELNKVEGLNWGAAPLARDKKYAAGSGAWLFAITSSCKNKDAAWQFLSKVMSSENASKFCQAYTIPPARKSVSKTLPFRNETPFAILMDGIENFGSPMPPIPSFLEVSDLTVAAFNEAANGEDIEQIVIKYTEEINKVLSR